MLWESPACRRLRQREREMGGTFGTCWDPVWDPATLLQNRLGPPWRIPAQQREHLEMASDVISTHLLWAGPAAEVARTFTIRVPKTPPLGVGLLAFTWTILLASSPGRVSNTRVFTSIPKPCRRGICELTLGLGTPGTLWAFSGGWALQGFCEDILGVGLLWGWALQGLPKNTLRLGTPHFLGTLYGCQRDSLRKPGYR